MFIYLLHSLYHVTVHDTPHQGINPGEHSNSQIYILKSNIRTEAISVFISGFDIFIPTKIDQILLLECLINKKINDDKLTNSIIIEDRNGYGVDHQIEEIPNHPTQTQVLNQSSFRNAVNLLPPDGTNSLLLAVLTHSQRVPVAWSYVPSTLQQNIPSTSTSSFSSPSSLSSSSSSSSQQKFQNKGQDPLRASLRGFTPVNIGDIVTRGPNWIYGQQDTHSYSNKDRREHEGKEDNCNNGVGDGVVRTGFVIKISHWCCRRNALTKDGKDDDKDEKEGSENEKVELSESCAGRCVTVQWDHGGVNTYRWGVPVQPLSTQSVPIMNSKICLDSMSDGLHNMPHPTGTSSSSSSSSSSPSSSSSSSSSFSSPLLNDYSSALQVLRYYDLEHFDSAKVEVEATRQVMEFTPGQIHESLTKGFGDIQSTEVKKYLNNEIINRNKRKRTKSKISFIGKEEDENDKDKKEKNYARFVTAKKDDGQLFNILDDACTSSDLYFQYEKYFAMYGAILPEKFSLFYNGNIDNDCNVNIKEDINDEKINEEDGICKNINYKYSNNNYYNNNSVTLSTSFYNLIILLSKFIQVSFPCGKPLESSSEKKNNNNDDDENDYENDNKNNNIENNDNKNKNKIKNKNISYNKNNRFKSNSKNYKEKNIYDTITENASNLLILLQGLIIGYGEEITVKNLSKLSVNFAELKYRLAVRSFYGFEKNRTKWNWRNGIWNSIPKSTDKKKNKNQKSNSEKPEEKILSNLLFDPTYVPDSLVLTESKRTVHQCWNRRWGTALANISLHPDTGKKGHIFLSFPSIFLFIDVTSRLDCVV